MFNGDHYGHLFSFIIGEIVFFIFDFLLILRDCTLFPAWAMIVLATLAAACKASSRKWAYL